MITHIDATVIGGVLHPDQPIPLPDRSRVRLTIEPIEALAPEKARSVWELLKASLAKQPLHLGGKRFSRDELYERR
jgi:hypothetical protein